MRLALPNAVELTSNGARKARDFEMADKVQPGIHSSVQEIIDREFSKPEKKIVKYWSNEWFITNAGKRTVGRSVYYFILIKPAEHIAEALNLSQEMFVIFSPYELFEPRTLEAYDVIRRDFLDQRYEKMCYALISADEHIADRLSSYISRQENQIIVPFSYHSFDEHRSDASFIRNTFRQNFYSRDLFDYSEPLRKDTFFFGRSDIVTTVIEKHKSGSNYGLFGLRKTGKTSIIYDVCRKSDAQGFLAIVVDCQNTSFSMKCFLCWRQMILKTLDTL